MRSSRRRAIVLSLVERGWRAARECSLDVQPQAVSVVHLIKGHLSRAVVALIAPYPGIRLISVDRALFWPAAWLIFVWFMLRGRLRSVLVDNDRSFRRLRRWVRFTPVSLVVVGEGREGYELWAGQQRVSRAAWYAVLGGPCGSH